MPLNLGDLINPGIGAVSGLGGMAFNANQSRLAFERSQYLLNREHELNEQSAQAAYERELQADSSKYQRQTADLLAAGLNPMLAVGQSAGAVHSSAASASAPSGPMSSAPNLGGILEGIQLNIQKRVADADIALKEAQARNLESKTAGQQIENWIQEHTKELQVESAALENDLKKGDIALNTEKISKMREEVGLLIRQQKSEEARAGVLLVEQVLKSAQAEQIVALLPYQKALMSAQASNEKAAAALAWAHEVYQRGLIDNGYLDSFCRQAVADANTAESQSAIAGVKAAVQSGDYSHSSIGYVPVISEAVTGISQAFGVVGQVFGASYGSHHTTIVK